MNKRERVMLMIAIAVLGGVCLKFFVYDPQETAYASLEQTRDTAASDLQRHQQIMLRSSQVRAQYERLAGRLATVEAKLPTDDEVPALLAAMERFTTRLGMRMISISPGATAPATSDDSAKGSAAGKSAPYLKMPLKLTVRGRYPQVVQFFTQLRDFPRLVVVNNISVAPEKLPELTVGVDADIFVLSATAPPGPPAKPTP